MSTKKEMIVAGVMSGTSADGINVAFVRFTERFELERERNFPLPRKIAGEPHGSGSPAFELLGHAEYPYPKKVRTAILAAMNSSCARVADLARMNFLLGELYSDAALSVQRQFKLRADLVGCHGQTLYHQAEPVSFLGRKITATWQTGEAAVIAAKVGVPVVSDFRPSDMSAGGKGAPLVPFLDSMLFRDPHVGRIVQNIGGIANLTAIPAGARAGDVIAFDTGPGNMVVDAVSEELFGKQFDRNGRIAASGVALEGVISKILREEFFRKHPPKTAGREQFGREFVDRFLQACKNYLSKNSPKKVDRKERRWKEDALATATALTARSITDAARSHLGERMSSPKNKRFEEMILSGGGAKNPTLVAMLRQELASLGIRLGFSDEFGVPSEAKEAMAFALLAYETWHRRPSNVPSATGAKRNAVLGKISYP